MGFKKTKRRVKKIRKKDKPMPEEMLLDDTRNTDFGSRFSSHHHMCVCVCVTVLAIFVSLTLSLHLSFRIRGRGRKELDQEGQEGAGEGSSAIKDVPQQSDDIRMADMDISDDGEEVIHDLVMC